MPTNEAWKAGRVRMKKTPTSCNSQNNKYTGKKGYSSLQESNIKSLQSQTHQKKRRYFSDDRQSQQGKNQSFTNFERQEISNQNNTLSGKAAHCN